jgi:hypothetical protein
VGGLGQEIRPPAAIDFGLPALPQRQQLQAPWIETAVQVGQQFQRPGGSGPHCRVQPAARLMSTAGQDGCGMGWLLIQSSLMPKVSNI